MRRPFDWPAPLPVLVGDELRPHDAGNVNAVETNGCHYLACYSGTDRNTAVYVSRGVKPAKCASGASDGIDQPVVD